jgi:hypothetical protein
MSQQFNQDELRDMASRCLEEGRNITDWETNFLTSISEQLDRIGSLSEKQQEILDRIYTEKVP